MMRTTVSTQPQIIIVVCCITQRRSAYGAWGNYSVHDKDGKKTTDATFIGHINPLRYRGYYYDRETRLYYLQSRYYDFVNCRFINADTFATTDANGFLSANMFAYCENNPVMRTDETGEFWNVVIGAAVGGIISGLVAGITSYRQNGSVDWASVAINFGVGAISGAIAATGLSAVAQAGLTAVVSATGSVADQWAANGLNNVSYSEVLGAFALGFVTSYAGTGAGELVAQNLKQAGEATVRSGQDKLLTGVVRRSCGQSHSAYMRQGRKIISSGRRMLNKFRGISSILGSFLSGWASVAYNHHKRR